MSDGMMSEPKVVDPYLYPKLADVFLTKFFRHDMKSKSAKGYRNNVITS